ncbi:hypothetical protein Bca4012_072386 [Brassica carinata]
MTVGLPKSTSQCLEVCTMIVRFLAAAEHFMGMAVPLESVSVAAGLFRKWVSSLAVIVNCRQIYKPKSYTPVSMKGTSEQPLFTSVLFDYEATIS